ncbi:YggS family pyridoxal phosphate-dependent enzyme [Pelagibacteraceae bacterium]|nr:YggS family pyridoxal phosphate-dependent enzyme [Pelagibacteraceae bacterium]
MSRYQHFIQNFTKAVLRTKRNIEEIEIIAVSKRKQISDIQLVMEEGHLSFGENQLQEVVKKWPDIRMKESNTRLHFIGGIQSKKLSDIVNHCDVIHTIDREKLLPILKKIDNSVLVNKDFFIQINTGNEAQKSGVSLNKAENFIEICKNNDIQIKGLMCLPPINEPSEKHFQIMQNLAINNHIKYLSMGMSNDYETALRYGSTHIRVGTAIFGERN